MYQTDATRLSQGKTCEWGGWTVHDLMVKFPANWPDSVVVIVCMVVLAALDLVGALAAAEGLARRSNVLLALGALSFLLLFWFYASSLQYAELAVVTFGWIVLLQISLLLLDRIHYGVSLAPGKWVAIVVILAAQAYLVLGQSPSVGAAPKPRPAAMTTYPTDHGGRASRDGSGGRSPVKGQFPS
jgi:hypothetical protein